MKEFFSAESEGSEQRIKRLTFSKNEEALAEKFLLETQRCVKKYIIDLIPTSGDKKKGFI